MKNISWIKGGQDELRKVKETFNGFKQHANVFGFEIHQMKDTIDRQIELCPTLKHDSLHYQNIKVQLLKKECEEEKSMLAETQDGRQELEVTENNLKQVTKVNNEEMMEFKHEILNLSTVCRKIFM